MFQAFVHGPLHGAATLRFQPRYSGSRASLLRLGTQSYSLSAGSKAAQRKYQWNFAGPSRQPGHIIFINMNQHLGFNENEPTNCRPSMHKWLPITLTTELTLQKSEFAIYASQIHKSKEGIRRERNKLNEWTWTQVKGMNEPMWYPNSSPIFSLVVVICYAQEDAHDHAKVPSSWVPGGMQKQTHRRRWFRRSPPPVRPSCRRASCWRPEAMCSSLDSSGTDSLEGMLGHGPRWSMVVNGGQRYWMVLLLHKGCLQRSPVSWAPCHG